MLNTGPISAETLAVFVTASVALGLAPGPDNIFVLTQSIVRGRLAGLSVTAGLCTGLLFHTAAVTLGVAAVFAASAMAFNLLKMVGCAYLLYLAWQAFKTAATDVPGGNGPEIHHGRLYARGVVMNLTNPKVAIFFLAFLPQFADPAQGSMTSQIAVLGAVFIAVTLLVFGSIAWFSGGLGERFKSSPRAQMILNRTAGAVFVGLAARLALVER